MALINNNNVKRSVFRRVDTMVASIQFCCSGWGLLAKIKFVHITMQCNSGESGVVVGYDVGAIVAVNGRHKRTGQ